MCLCVVVLVGVHTAERKWARHGIERGWRREKGICAVDVHNLKDYNGDQSTRGLDPILFFYVGKKFNESARRTARWMLMKSVSVVSVLCISPSTPSAYVYDEIKEILSRGWKRRI